jgi:hypothetical protein
MTLRTALLVAGIAAPGLTAAAEERTLVHQSPFGRADAVAENAGTPSPELELRGIMSTPSGIQYCIYDPGRKSSVWASVEDAGNGFLVRSGNPDQDEVTIQEDGRTVTLRMHEGKVTAAQAEQPAQQAPAASPVAARRRPGDPRAPRGNPNP